MILFGYWRSSASWRVRIGLELKGLAYDVIPVNLLTSAQKSPEHLARNPLGQVPALQLADGTILTQSMAILDHLDHLIPTPPLFPRDSVGRARVFALAEVVNSGIQPLQNLGILKAVTELGGDRKAWGRDVIQAGLEALQRQAQPHAGQFMYGDTVTVADACLIPQLYNARRFDCDLTRLPLLTAIESRATTLPAFAAAHPNRQPDATESQ